MNKIFLIILYFLFSSALLAQKKIEISLSPKTSNFEVINTKSTSLLIKNSISKLTFVEDKKKSSQYTILEASGLIKIFGKGMPQLPVRSQLIQIPEGYSADVKIVSFKEELIDLSEYGVDNPIIPAQPSKRKTEEKINFYKNEEFYKQNNFLKSEKVKIENLGTMRTVQLARIEIQPFEYNPQKNLLKVYSQMEVEVVFTKLKSTQTLNSQYKSVPFSNLINENVINSNFSSAKALLTTTPLTYVIVADRMFEAQLQEFIEWKTLKGFHVITAYTDEIGQTTTEIKAYLQNLYENPAENVNPPSFALLVGDVQQIPAWSGIDSHATDLRYFEYTGDYFPEVFYGRFSAQNTTQLQAQIDKTLMYEKYQMSDPSYLGRSLLVAGVDESNAPTYGNGPIRYIQETYLNTDHEQEAFSYLYNDAANSTVMQSNSGSASSSIRGKVSEGVGIANYTAHCSSAGWYDPAFNTSHVSSLTNNEKYGLMIGNCCQSSTFDDSECFAEAVLRATDKGAIGYLGASDYSYWDEDYFWGVGVAAISSQPTYETSGMGAYDALFHDKVNESQNQENWYITQGQMMMAGNLSVEASTSELKEYYWEIYNLMGDPSLMPYLRVPEKITATIKPSSLLLGQSSFQVSTKPYSTIAFSQNGSLISVVNAGETGNVSVEFPEQLLILGTAQIVITGQNGQPYFADIVVAPANEPYVSLNTWQTDIAPDYGKTVNLTVNLKNLAALESSYDAQNVEATLSTTDEYVTLIDSVEDVDLISAGDSLTLENAFSFSLAENISDGHIVKFELVVTGEDGKYTWNSYFSMKANAPQIEISELSVANDNNLNGFLDPGENGQIVFQVRNTGNASANFVGNLSLVDPQNLDLSLFSSQVSQVINANSSVAFPYNAEANSETLIGTEVGLKLDVLVGDNAQYNAMKETSISIGEMPVYLINEPENVTTCLALFYDSGNSTAEYNNDEEFTKTFYATDNSILQIEFLEFDLEADYDYLYVYDGEDINSSQIAGSPFSGTDLPPILTSSNALTFKFVSDGGVTKAGWKASVKCIEPKEAPVCVSTIFPANNSENVFPFVLRWNSENATDYELYFGTDSNPLNNDAIFLKSSSYSILPKSNTTYYWTVIPKNKIGSPEVCDTWQFTTGVAVFNMANTSFYNVCEGKFVDSGGENQDYSSNENYQMTLYPNKENGRLILNFTEFAVESKTAGGCWDYLSIYDGSSTNDELIGEFCGDSVLLDLKEIKATNSEGALTFVFSSDVSEEKSGWSADITCGSLTSTTDFESLGLKLYPNPNNGNFNLLIPDFLNSELNIQVFDLSGKLVYSDKTNSLAKNHEFDLSYLMNGIYTVRITSAEFVRNQKIIIQK